VGCDLTGVITNDEQQKQGKRQDDTKGEGGDNAVFLTIVLGQKNNTGSKANQNQ